MRHYLALAFLAAFSASVSASLANLGGSDSVCRLSKLKGKDVVTSAGEKIGEVQDTIVDTKSGAIAYLIVDFNKSTGTKDMLHAVPWTAFTESTTKPRAEHLVLVFDKGKLVTAPHFERSAWPTMEGTWGTDADKYYGQRRFNDFDRIGRTQDASADPMKTPSDSDARLARPAMLRRASKVIGLTVQNRAGETLGEIEDLAVSPGRSKILYAVLASGGFLGMGEKLHAIPCHAFTFAPDGLTCVLDVDKERLKKAPTFDKTAWPLTADDSFTTELNRYWAERPTTRPG